MTTLSTLNIVLCCPCLILPYGHAVHAQYCLTATFNIILCSPRSILPYAVHAQTCLMLSTLLCSPRTLLLYAVHIQSCLMLVMIKIALCSPRSILPMLNIALCSLRLILPYSHRYTRSILPYAAVHARYCLVLSMLNIALQTRCPH